MRILAKYLEQDATTLPRSVWDTRSHQSSGTYNSTGKHETKFIVWNRVNVAINGRQEKVGRGLSQQVVGSGIHIAQERGKHGMLRRRRQGSGGSGAAG